MTYSSRGGGGGWTRIIFLRLEKRILRYVWEYSAVKNNRS